jgi:hypothetical protein
VELVGWLGVAMEGERSSDGVVEVGRDAMEMSSCVGFCAMPQSWSIWLLAKAWDQRTVGLSRFDRLGEEWRARSPPIIISPPYTPKAIKIDITMLFRT